MLSDPSGCQVTIRQLGSAPDDPKIQSGRHVVAYFVSGTKAWNGGESGSSWTYEDSFIQVGSRAASVPSFTKEVSILESQSRHRTAANFHQHHKQFAIASPELVSSPSPVITSLRRTIMDITVVAAFHRTPSIQKLVFYYPWLTSSGFRVIRRQRAPNV